MFEVNGTYANRKGTYTVLSFSGRKMTVRYEDGSVADLNVGIQERIWENILAEREAVRQKQSKNKVSTGINFVKTISVSEESDLSLPGLKQRVCATPLDRKFKPGDRMIYYAVENKLFFAVATVTTKPKKAKAKDYIFGGDPKAKIFLYPIDVEAHIKSLELAIAADSVELESVPNHEEALASPEQYVVISEDDFELLAESIMEVDADVEDEVETDDATDEDAEDILEIDA